MNYKLKTLLVLSGAALLAVPALQAQVRGGSGGRGGFATRPVMATRSAFASRPAGRVLANNALHNGSLNATRGYRGGSYYRGGYHHGYGRYYYLGGVSFFYPFYGFGYGYGGFYGDGFYGGYGDGAYGGAGTGYNGENGAYEGRISNQGNGRNTEGGDDQQGVGSSLPSAVQRQLAKRGYYKGAVDGQFGAGSRDALKRFQKSQGLKATGNIDEDSLDALGFTDQRR